MIVGVISVGVMIIGVLSVGVMTLFRHSIYCPFLPFSKSRIICQFIVFKEKCISVPHDRKKQLLLFLSWEKNILTEEGSEKNNYEYNKIPAPPPPPSPNKKMVVALGQKFKLK